MTILVLCIERNEAAVRLPSLGSWLCLALRPRRRVTRWCRASQGGAQVQGLLEEQGYTLSASLAQDDIYVHPRLAQALRTLKRN